MLKTVGLLDYSEAEEEADEAAQTAMKKVIKQARDKALKERVMAMLFLQNVDRARYGRKYDEIDEASELGRDEFPITLTAAFNVLVMKEHRVIEAHHRTNRYRDGRQGLSFVQGGGRGDGSGRGMNGGQGGRGGSGRGGTDTHYANGRPRECPENEEPVPGINGKVIRNMLCFCCNRYGHGRQYCPEWVENGGTREVRNFLTRGLLFNNVVKDFLLRNNIYLIDCAASHSTVSSLGNIKNLTNCLTQDILYTITNSGNISFEERGDLDFLPLKPYVNTKSVANILAFHELNALPGAHIKFDGSKEDAFFLVFDSGRVVKFTRCDVGLYFYDSEKKENHEFTANGFTMLQKREDLEKLMTKKEVNKATKVRFYQELIGWPATGSMNEILSNGEKNADVGANDVEKAVVLGEPEALSKGKMTRKHPTPHKTRHRLESDPR
jgi:hypothetical protein